ncbi:MAG: phage tail protein [bacterium]|nr:phage tail protein [bacterium]
MKLHRDNGVVIGVVVDLEDPLGIGRILVQYPYLEEKYSEYARLVVPMAGPERGTFFRPEIDDEVLVAFERGEPRRPYILGSLWSTVDVPPLEQGKKKENDLRVTVSRSGHIFSLDDTPDKEKIEIIDKDDKRRVVIDCAEKKIQVICDDGDIEVFAKSGTVKVEAKNVEVKAQESAKVEATDVEVKAKSSVKVEGMTVEVKAKGSMTLEAGGPMTIKGATVAIN